MHPKLLENTNFLNYYAKWQEDPGSLVFLPIAEFFIQYGMIEEAVTVCELGLSYHPNLISGQLILAKIYLKKGQNAEARTLALKVLHQIPNHYEAKALLDDSSVEPLKAEVITVTEVRAPVDSVPAPQSTPPPEPITPTDVRTTQKVSWQTVTMANIYATQGHLRKAESIYRAVLERNPENREARKGLEKVSRRADDSEKEIA